MSLPKHIGEFDLLQFINRRAELIYVSCSMEIQLEEFKKKNPAADLTEALKRISIVQDQTEFMAKLERELLTKQRVNSDYILANLQLMKENEQLKIQIETLTKQMQEL